MTTDDLEAVIAIQARAHLPEFHESRESFACKLARAGQTAWLALDEAGRAMGYCLALVWHTELPLPELDAGHLVPVLAPDCLYLHDLAVVPEAGGQGVGRHLAGAVCAEAAAQGLEGVLLVALDGSAGWWRRLGWCDLSTRTAPAGYGPGAAVLFRLSAPERSQMESGRDPSEGECLPWQARP